MNTENNRLLAEFMGLKPKLESPDVYSYSDMPFFSVREDCPEKVMKSISKYAKYDSSWDWLMPVVIECFNRNESLSDDLNFKLNDALLETNINSLYNACVDFVKYYNKEYSF